tara:strand:+ start:456 stop:701 length:246 start_codon:yes stop_codon:yes gene_type:complete
MDGPPGSAEAIQKMTVVFSLFFLRMIQGTLEIVMILVTPLLHVTNAALVGLELAQEVTSIVSFYKGGIAVCMALDTNVIFR